MRFSMSQAYEMIRANARAITARVAHSIIPKSKDEETRRCELILNVILIVSIVFLSVLEATTIYDYVTIDSTSYDGLSPFQFAPIIVFFCGLYVLSRKGYVRIASYMLIGAYIVGTLYSGWIWGESLPATLLSTAIVIVTSSVLIGSTAGLSIAALTVGALFFLGIHERLYLHVPFWRHEQISITDIVSYSGIFLFISFITWLSNREIHKSLRLARTSEKLLQLERDTLEKKIAERTREIMYLETERMHRLENAATFGTFSQGVVHDLMSSISSLSVHFESIPDTTTSLNTSRESMRKIVEISRRMNSFMGNMRQYIARQQRVCTSDTANVTKEIEIIKDICAHRVRNGGITLECCTPPILIYQINQIYVHQIILNLVTNAIEAHEEHVEEDGCEKIIRISAYEDSYGLTISVWNNGPVISNEIMKNLWINALTTKQEGSGNGLPTVYRIVKGTLNGSISAKSTIESGTEFTVKLPQHPSA